MLPDLALRFAEQHVELEPVGCPVMQAETASRNAADVTGSAAERAATQSPLAVQDRPSQVANASSLHSRRPEPNAAGWGWFVDLTPWDDSEFTTFGNQGELNRMDLLSVLMPGGWPHRSKTL